jgi:hypothetical protein
MDSLSLIIGILFAIPLSIAANLLTPRVALWWARRSGALPRKRLARIDFELKRIKHVDDNPIDVLAQIVSLIAQAIAKLGVCLMFGMMAFVTLDQVRQGRLMKVFGLSLKQLLYGSTGMLFIAIFYFAFWVSVRMDISTPLSLLTYNKRNDLRYQLTWERHNIIEKHPELAESVDNFAPKAETPTKPQD